MVQGDALLALSTVIVAPTSTAAPARSFRPEIHIAGAPTRVLVEQLGAVDHGRLGDSVGSVNSTELDEIDRALAVVLGIPR